LVRSASGDEGRIYFRGESTISHKAAVLNRPRKATFTFYLKEVEQASSAKNMIQYLPGPSEVSIENYMDKRQGISTSAELLSASSTG
jgi:hypothetical protein